MVKTPSLLSRMSGMSDPCLCSHQTKKAQLAPGQEQGVVGRRFFLCGIIAGEKVLSYSAPGKPTNSAEVHMFPKAHIFSELWVLFTKLLETE